MDVLTSLQISEWMAYYSLEPFGERVEWLRSGVISSVIANVNRSRKDKRFSPEDFMPREDNGGRPQRQTVEQQRARLQQIYNYARKKKLTKDK